MNWLDWLLMIIIGLSALQGLRTGLIAGVSRLLGLVAGIAAAYTWHRPLALYFDRQLGWGDSVANFLLKWLPQPLLQGMAGSLSLTDLKQFMPIKGMQKGAAVGRDIPAGLADLAHQLALSLLELFSFIVLLIAITMVVSMIFRIFSGVIAVTPFGPLNRLGGLVLGLARGILIVLVIVMLLQQFMPAGAGENGMLGRAAANSNFMPYVRQALDLLNLHFPGLPPAGGLLKAVVSKYA
jgi:uncharacterized membrane protein required for colicin V production